MSSQPLWLDQRERGSAWLIRALATIALTLGRPVTRALLYPICAYCMVFSRGAKEVSRDYLVRVLPRKPRWRDSFEHQLCFARTILDRVYLMSGRVGDFDCRIGGLDTLRGCIAKGQGCLLFGAHFGSFDMLRVIASAQCPVRVNVLMHEANAGKVDAALAALDAELPRHIIPLGHPQTMLRVAEAIRRGEIVALLADRVVAGDKMVPCHFLDGVAPFPAGPFALAAMLQVPVVLFCASYEGGNRYRIRFELFAERVVLPNDKTAARLETCYQHFADWLAANCRRAPYNWFNFYDFWARDCAL